MRQQICSKCQEFASEDAWKRHHGQCPSDPDCDGVAFEGFYIEPKDLLEVPPLTPTVQ